VQQQKGLWQIINITVPVLLVLFIGVFVQIRRKKMFAA